MHNNNNNNIHICIAPYGRNFRGANACLIITHLSTIKQQTSKQEIKTNV